MSVARAMYLSIMKPMRLPCATKEHLCLLYIENRGGLVDPRQMLPKIRTFYNAIKIPHN
jgi:hypothetical protein